MFDAYNEQSGMWLDPKNVSELADKFNIDRPFVFFEGKTNPAHIESIAGRTELGGELGE